jgi:hypothetical protein
MIPAVDRLSRAMRRLAWHAVTRDVPGVTPGEVLLDGLDALDDVRAALVEGVDDRRRVAALLAEVEELKRDLLHARANARLLSDSLRRTEASVQMLDRQQMASLAELDELRR